jgi:hypothetical protein
MSPNPYPVFSVSQYDKPDQIKVKIRMLIQLYLKDPNSFTADAVANHIAAMLAYPKYINDVEQRCLFRKMEKHWHCLAWIENTPVFSKNKKTSNMHKTTIN